MLSAVGVEVDDVVAEDGLVRLGARDDVVGGGRIVLLVAGVDKNDDVACLIELASNAEVVAGVDVKDDAEGVEGTVVDASWLLLEDRPNPKPNATPAMMRITVTR